MNRTEIILKEPDTPPKKLWLALGSFFFLAAAILATRGYLDAPGPTEPIPDAEIVSQTPEPRFAPTTEQGRSGNAIVVLVEPTADRKADLYPNAITNYLEAPSSTLPTDPLDPALHVARLGLERLKLIQSYTAKITKRERISGKLGASEILNAKIRRPMFNEGKATAPFSVYLKFAHPRSVAGREVLWVEGRENNKLLVREAGFLGLIPIFLDPESKLAMSDSRYPIWEIGFDSLIEKMIEKGERDQKIGRSTVEVNRWVELDQRPCTEIVIAHPEFQEGFDFHRAEIVIDDELNIPIHYAAYDFPEPPGGKPRLLEQYTYSEVDLDANLTEEDFQRSNPNYSF